ncbi:hypothetical protein P9112_003405 [Eukaryota sp. TZLM1-RC]
MIYLFRHPSTKTLRFEKAIQSNKEFKGTLTEISTIRDGLVRILHDRRPAAEILQNIDAYLPHLEAIMVSLNAESAPSTTRHLSPTWTSCVMKKSLQCSIQSLAYEAVMVYTLLAYATSVQAHLELFEAHKGGTFEMTLPSAAKLLLRSAGIIKSLAPHYTSLFKLPLERPVECLSTFGEALIALFEAEAQALIVEKAVSDKSPLVIAKLCFGVFDKCNAALSILKSMTSDYSDLSPDFVVFIEELGNFYRAKGLRNQAMKMFSNDKAGEAVGLLRAARDHINHITSPPGSRAPYFAEIFQNEVKEIENLLERYNSELTLVYFQSVVPIENIILEESFVIVEPIEYKTVEPEFQSIPV